ncbi:prolyl oligopeptidase family serine peptidase [Luteibacter sp. PPL552]
MIPFRLWLGALVALVFAMPAAARDVHEALRVEAARPVAPRMPRASFLQQAPVTDVTLSPDGGAVAFLRGDTRSRGVWLLDTATGGERMLLARTNVTGLAWTHDGRWLIVVAGERLSVLPALGATGARVLTSLGGAPRREFLAADPFQAAVLVRERTLDALGRPSGWRLSRITVDGRVSTLDEDPQRITGYAFADGRLAYLQHLRDGRLATTRLAADGSRHDVLLCGTLRRCSLWPVVAADGSVALVGDVGGDLRRLQRLRADGSLVERAADPDGEADVDEVVPDPGDGQPGILTFRGAVVHSVGLDDTTRDRLGAIARQLPDRALTFAPGRSHWLVTERGGALQGARYHLFDTATGTLTGILDDAPLGARDGRPGTWLPVDALARQIPFDWTASDGRRLHGFVRVPPGRVARDLPMVVLVHGGPWNHVAPDDFGSGYAAFLAHRGYVVFEPNFRGSTGFGRDYLLAAGGDLGNGRVQRDIEDGVRALLDAGAGDANRVAIVGASFGGYATLLALTWQGDLFKAGVAIVPPADFAWDLTWIGRTREGNRLSRELPYEQWMAAMSLDPGDGVAMSRLHAQSPLSNAARMHRPLLMIAGGADQRVALRGVLAYAARLRLLDRPVTLLVDRDAGHTDAGDLMREVAFYLTADMLHRQIGGDADDPPDAAMIDDIRTNTLVPR